MSRNEQSRRTFLARTGMAGAGSVLALQAGYGSTDVEKDQRPNVIFLFADQLRAHALGCYGNTSVPTPNLDRMAADGAVFDHAISTWPVCSPYRAMLLTGRHPMANGTVSNDTGLRGDLPTVGTAFKQHGYATGYIGKWHLEWNRDPFVPKSRRMGFDYWAVRNCSHDYLHAFYCGDTPEKIPLPEYEPIAQTDLAVEYIRRHKDHPFCLFLSWGTPHDPYDKVPDEYMARVPPDRIRLRGNVDERACVDALIRADPAQAEPGFAEQRRKRRGYLEDEAQLRLTLQGYYAHTAALDDCVGRLLDTLDETGLSDNTIVVFTSDHGDMLGSHRMGSKQMPYEESLHVPFILRYPARVPAGIRTDALLGPIDIMPTLLGLAGASCPPIDGLDVSGAVTGGADDQQDALLIMKMLPGGNPYALNAIPPWRGVRTRRYTYARIVDRGPWILYDNREDPNQLVNRIDDPAYARVRDELDRKTTDLLVAAGDPEDTAAIEAYRERRKAKAKRAPVDD